MLLAIMSLSRLQMSSTLRCGTSINQPKPSETRCRKISLLTSKTQETPTTCKFGPPTEDGTNNSSSPRTTSRIPKMEESLRSPTSRIQRVPTSVSASSPISYARNGQFSMWTRLKTQRLLVSTSLTKSTSEELSSSDLECQCKEFSLLPAEET